MPEKREIQLAVKPEIMSPAGYWPQLHAAVEAGADAVYFGLHHFTARAKTGFALQELKDVMRTLHQRGVKGYVTFNTLVFEHELAEAARTLAAIAEAGADSIIVQDLGIVQLARQVAPDLTIHGSTQMSITSAEGVALAQSFGVSRVVLARELSLEAIRQIRTATNCELEMFVHGALCVSYSGQCFSSEAWGGRSANRGQCAQACRLPYEMIVDGQSRPMGDARYLLSPGDLYALHQIPAILPIGISALKIEGRYKEANYVALATAEYRKAVDEAWAGRALSVTAADELRLEQVYSRGMGPHFVSGTNHQLVVNGRSPRHRGLRMGRVTRINSPVVVMDPSQANAALPLKPGDGVVFDAADWRSPGEPEEGGRVYSVTPRADGLWEIQFANGALNFHRIRPGDLIWRTDDPEIDKVARRYTAASSPVRKQPVAVHVSAVAGAPLHTEWRLLHQPEIHTVIGAGQPLEAAASRALDEAMLRDQLGRLGNTAYELAELTVELSGNPFAPASLLNQIRRRAVTELAASQGRTKPIGIHPPAWPQPASHFTPASAAQLHLLVRTPEQLEAAIAAAPASITLDYLELYGLRPSVDRVKASGIAARVASPRVLKPSEQRIVHFLLKLECPILVRSGGLLQALRDQPGTELIGDFSLNAANSLTANTLQSMGLHRLTPSHDLNADQIAELARAAGPGSLEVIAYQHLPVFHTEHCVFCRFLSTGTSYEDCGHPCEKHRVALRDHNGRAHPVMADVGCRNTVFGAEAQEASQHLEAWRTSGIAHFRLEFVHETPEQVTRIAAAFQRALTGGWPARELAAELKRIAPQGVTEGSLFVPANYRLFPVLQ